MVAYVRKPTTDLSGKVICTYSNPKATAQDSWIKILTKRHNGRVVVTSVQDLKQKLDIDGTNGIKTRWNSVALTSYEPESVDGRGTYIEFSCMTSVPDSMGIERVDPHDFRRSLETVLKSSSEIIWEGLKEKDVKISGKDVKETHVNRNVIQNPTYKQVGEITHDIMVLLGFREVVEK